MAKGDTPSKRPERGIDARGTGSRGPRRKAPTGEIRLLVAADPLILLKLPSRCSDGRTMKNLQSTPETPSSTRKVIGMHFVCRDNIGVLDDGNGIFRTGSWKIDPRHAETVKYVALHSSRSEPSYRQGHVLGCYENPFEPGRFVLIVHADNQSREWRGRGTGEKGYLWND